MLSVYLHYINQLGSWRERFRERKSLREKDCISEKAVVVAQRRTTQ